MKWGWGKAMYRNKAQYEGHFFMDKRHGYGRMWYSNAGTYEVHQGFDFSRGWRVCNEGLDAVPCRDYYMVPVFDLRSVVEGALSRLPIYVELGFRK